MDVVSRPTSVNECPSAPHEPVQQVQRRKKKRTMLSATCARQIVLAKPELKYTRNEEEEESVSVSRLSIVRNVDNFHEVQGKQKEVNFNSQGRDP